LVSIGWLILKLVDIFQSIDIPLFLVLLTLSEQKLYPFYIDKIADWGQFASSLLKIFTLTKRLKNKYMLFTLSQTNFRAFNCRQLLLLIALMVWSKGLLAQSPDDEKSQLALVHEFIAMFNSSERNAVSAFIDRHLAQSTLDRFGDEGRSRYIGYISGEKQFHRSFKLGAIKKLEQRNGSDQYQARVSSHNTELGYHLTLGISQGKPFKVTGVRLRPANDTQATKGSLSKKEFTESIASYVDRLAERGVFSGAVLVADDQDVIYQAAKGFASIRYRIKNNSQTKFNLGSMNKMFTGLSVMQLVEQQKLSLDDKLVEYVDRSLLGEGDFEQITIEQLLTHTSGLGWANYPELSQASLRNLNDHKPYLKYIPLSNPPGTRFGYSNDGMALLGMVIERVSGLSYYDYVRKHVYKVAGMVNSDSFDVDLPVPNLAMGYYYSAEHDSMQSNLFVHPIKGGPAGGGYSTVEDLYQFSKALTGHQLLSKELTEEAYSAKPELNSPRYGYGFFVQGDSDNRIIGHSGAYMGVSSILSVYLDKGFTVIVLANQSFARDPVVSKIESLIQQL